MYAERCETLRNRVATLERENDQLKATTGKLQVSVPLLQNDVDKLKSQADKLDAPVKNLLEKLGTLKGTDDPSDAAAIWLGIDEVDAAASGVETQLATFQNQFGQFKSSFETWGQQVSAASGGSGASIPNTEAKPDPQELTVYVTNTGAKYHRPGCSYLARSSNPMTKKNAIAAGYTPCSRCNP